MIINHNISISLFVDRRWVHRYLSGLGSLARQIYFQDTVQVASFHPLRIDRDRQREASLKTAEGNLQAHEAPDTFGGKGLPFALHHQFGAAQGYGNVLGGNSGQIQTEHQTLAGFIKVRRRPEGSRSLMGFPQRIKTSAPLLFQAVEVSDYANFDESMHEFLKPYFQ
jgi:hypothetical protein